MKWIHISETKPLPEQSPIVAYGSQCKYPHVVYYVTGKGWDKDPLKDKWVRMPKCTGSYLHSAGREIALPFDWWYPLPLAPEEKINERE